jgi:peptidoglycan/xylan/chitin deacetylase (PgdA/CDA1 family)
VLGAAIEGREDVLRRAVGEGHELGNHAWSHQRPASLTDGELRDELARTAAEIERVAGVSPRLLRPPYGDDPERFEAVGERVLWTVDPEDWTEPPAEEIVVRVLREAEPDAIVLLHDGVPRDESARTRQPTVDAVARLLPALGDRGYTCVTVSELLNRRPGR